jgi:accessory gene regulator protein AgrB
MIDPGALVQSKHVISCCCASLDFFVFPAYKNEFLTLLRIIYPGALVQSKHAISCCCASLDFFVFPAYKNEFLTLLNKKIPTQRVEISFVTPKGFEPLTFALEGRCSIQLSYGAIIVVFQN